MVLAQNPSQNFIQNGDQITYNFRSTGAFIPYANNPLHVEIVSITDPYDILVDVFYNDADITEAQLLNSSVSSGWYILNNGSLRNNWLNCPLQNLTESKIQEFWISDNLLNVSEYYFEVERSGLELTYSYDTEFHGDNYSVSVRWLWDYTTGVLLNNRIEFENLFDYSLSGVYELYLESTTMWELSTNAIPGFPLIWIFSIIGFSIVALYLLVSKKISTNFSNRSKRLMKVLVISTIFLSSSFLLAPNAIPTASAATERTMPGVNVLLLTNNTDSVIATSLGLDDTIHYSQYTEGVNSTDDLLALDYSKFETIIADSYLPDNLTVLHKIKSAINGTDDDLGLIFFGGNYSENALLTFSSILPVEFVINRGALNHTIVEFFIEQSGFPIFTSTEYYAQLYEQTNFFEIQTDDIQVSVSDEQEALTEEAQSMYVTRIAWESTPLLYERILTYAKKPSADTLIEVPDTKEPLVVTWDHDWDGDNTSSQVIYVSPGIATIWDYTDGKNDEWNTPFHLWPYFNYFLYMMVYDIKGLEPAEIESYAEWPWSPIPHRTEAIIWMVFVGSLWVFNFTLFFVLRRKSKKRDLAKNDSSPNLENTEKDTHEDTKEESTI